MSVLPAPVAEFTTAHFTTVADLDALATCMEADRWWSPTGIAAHLCISTHAARRALDHLARRNFLDIRVSDDVRYRFAPGAAELRAAAEAWLAVYRRDPLPVLKLVTSSRIVHDFANAFRIRPGDNR